MVDMMGTGGADPVDRTQVLADLAHLATADFPPDSLAADAIARLSHSVQNLLVELASAERTVREMQDLRPQARDKRPGVSGHR